MSKEAITHGRFLMVSAKNAKEAAILAGSKLTELIRGESEVLLLLSAGSSFRLLQYIDHSMLGPHITCGVIDERATADPEFNNFINLEKHDFFDLAEARGVVFLESVPKQDETAEALAARVERSWRHWKATHPCGNVVAVLGVGDDGHTAGIFPARKSTFKRRFETPNWVHGYDEPKIPRFPRRVSATATFLVEVVDAAIFFAVGEAKREILREVMKTSRGRSRVPARVLHSMKKVILFSDTI
ncbi:MAG: hypothetical protein A2928_03315 [Candidatus Taylorbacteria bacterium RIFCSPLOWO2_01_FULL_45_15b]|uniref:Glucosamine/galactosamine-6-phosphate isomerase domain-containing protein n=1 Tax=Candidatus Taylorbacteria bacterium RIFCSPLOWO2_01_FULL_45_15b TaxID=1802319 RepID=A0A1G2NFW3_9BACT|nr:MAG: hypothetical protein A2928_03315 [Candidatus Taylorbacteria bacterium RIFCSPLOWO2_01_FULL_45_15b]